MRIILSGAQGVGKSTLNKALFETGKFQGFTQLDSLSAKFANTKYEMDSLKFQQNITLYAYSEYLNTDNYISSRGIADGYAYQKYGYFKKYDSHLKTLMDLSLQLAYQFENAINVYVPIMFDLEKTHMRSGDSEFQEIIDRHIQEYFKITRLPFYTLRSLDINERVEEILDLVENRKFMESTDSTLMRWFSNLT